jgi:hypothetical protein
MKMNVTLAGHVNDFESDDIKVQFLRSEVELEFWTYTEDDDARRTQLRISKDDWKQIAGMI